MRGPKVMAELMLPKGDRVREAHATKLPSPRIVAFNSPLLLMPSFPHALANSDCWPPDEERLSKLRSTPGTRRQRGRDFPIYGGLGNPELGGAIMMNAI